MKKFFIIVKIILIQISLFYFLSCNIDCDVDCDNSKEIELISEKQDYIAGETFSTTGDKVFLLYTEEVHKIIKSGFIYEWSKGTENHNSYSDWYADDSAWKPIKHGDPLPVSPSDSSPSYFYVRAVYKGMKSRVPERIKVVGP